MQRSWTLVLIVAVLAGLLAIGLFSGRFVVYLTMRVMILAIFALGYNLLLGRTGLLSFGHAAFYAGGAYGLGLFSIHVSQNPLLGILVGVMLACVLAIIVGFFCVRHTEIYFAMLTLAFGMMVFSLIWNMREITGGDDGLVGIMRTSIPLGFTNIPLSKTGHYYYFVLFWFALSVGVIYLIRNSPFGLILSGLRENDRRVEFAGLSVKNYRLAAFVISGTFAGLAGSLGALLESNTDPFSAHWSHSAEPILVSLIGGIQTFAGPLVGSVIFVVLREIIERFTQNWMLWFGIILLVIIMGLRGGVVGGLTQLFQRGRSVSNQGGNP
ncbi:MAG: branched-chain amino acid ABC transporter permease [Deltaproteobacteria bacterium]|nr:branched-chain amino acid ABC transporter permease [Deltaproteobacteria bacterium]